MGVRKRKKYDPCKGIEQIVRQIVGRLHVGQPDREAAEYAESRLKRGASDSARRKVRACAVRIHRKNQKLYSQVMR